MKRELIAYKTQRRNIIQTPDRPLVEDDEVCRARAPSLFLWDGGLSSSAAWGRINPHFHGLAEDLRVQFHENS